MKRTVSFLLAALFLLTLVLSAVGCADQAQTQATVTATQSERLWLDNLPADLRFDGETYDIALAGYNATNKTDNSYKGLVVDEASGDAVAAEVFKRNEKIEQRFGIDIKIAAAVTPSLSQSNLFASIQAGTDDYDLLAGPQEYDYPLAAKGLLQNVYNYSDYLDLTAEYWGKGINNEYEYNGYLAFITGPLSLSYCSGWYCLFMNTDIYNKYLFAEYGSIYDIVREGNWTFDLFLEMIEKGYIDNGSIADQVDKKDQLGLFHSEIRLNALAVGLGVSFSKRTADGKIEIAINSNETIAATEKLIELQNTKGAHIEPMGNCHITDFANGNILFGLETIGNSLSLLEMQQGFTLLPLPKMEAGDSPYRNHFNGWFQHFGIPMGAPNGVMSAAVLEALTAESYRSVMPVWYDEALKYRYTRDDDTADMIDLIRNSAYVDFALGNTSELNKISDFFYNNPLNSITSTLKSQERTIKKMLEKLLEKYDGHIADGV